MDTATAQEPAAHMTAPEIELVPISACVPSPTNPRKNFDKAKLAELAESIKLHGVLQALLVRPLAEKGPVGAKYEIVAGERRWRAAKLAGHAHVPVSIRAIADVQVLELQLTENLQRDDLDPLEEADGYKRLMALKKINADQLAELLGKSRSYVYTRTKLNDLCPEARKALIEGRLDASRGLLISRIGHHDTQRQCLKDALASRYGRGPMVYRELQEHIHENYMLRIVDAPFDAADAGLVPKAGPCTTCPKRTGNQPDLFGDVKRADVCTDPKCFDDKRQAHFGAARKDLESQGYKVIAGDAAKKVMPWWDEDSDHRSNMMEGGYVRLDAETYATGRSRKVSEILPADFKPVLIQHPRTGRIIKAATQQAVAAAAGKPQRRSPSGLPIGSRAASKPKGPDIDDVEMERLVALLHKNAPKAFGKEYMHAFAKEIVDAYGPVRNGHDAIAKAWGWKGKPFGGGYYYGGRKLPKEALKLNDRDLTLLMMQVIFVSQYQRDAWLKLFDIDGKEVREQIIADRREASAAARAEKKTKADAAKKPVKPAAKGKKK